MKKWWISLLLVVVLVLFTGCDLSLLLGNSGTVYFYTMAGEDNEASSYRLRHRNEGYTIIMSRSIGDEEPLSKERAEEIEPTTSFTLELDDDDVASIEGSKTVDELGNTGWHVVESFKLPELSKGTHTLFGVTNFGPPEGGTRENLVTLEIY